MRVAELLSECQRTFLSQCKAEMQRDGIPEKQIGEILESTEDLLKDYNDHVLRTLAGGIDIVSTHLGGIGGAEA